MFKLISKEKACVDVQLLSAVLVKARIKKRKSILTAVHVGGFIGEVALRTEELLKPYPVRSYVVEPCIKNFKALLEIAKSNDNFIPIRKAIGAKSEIKYLYTQQIDEKLHQTSQSNSFYADFLTKEKTSRQKVEAISLCDLILENGIKKINLLRVNCEGGEYEIFGKSSDLSFLDKVEVLSLALHGKAKIFLTDKKIKERIAISKRLSSAGFKQVYGFNLRKSKNRIPVGHIWQIWIKKK